MTNSIDRKTFLNEVLTDFTSLYIQEHSKYDKNKEVLLQIYEEAKKRSFSGLIYTSLLKQDSFANSVKLSINPFSTKYIKNEFYIHEVCEVLLGNLDPEGFIKSNKPGEIDNFTPKVLALKQIINNMLTKSSDINIIDIVDVLETIEFSEIQPNLLLNKENIKPTLDRLNRDFEFFKEDKEMIRINYSSSTIDLENVKENTIYFLENKNDVASNSINAVIISLYARLNMKMDLNNIDKLVILDNIDIFVPGLGSWPAIARSCKFKLVVISDKKVKEEQSDEEYMFKINCNTIMVELYKDQQFEVLYTYKKEKNGILKL